MTEAEGSTYAVIVAAGRGVRAGGELPKQWQDLAGARVFDHALAAFAGHPAINGVLAVIHPDDAGLLPDNVDWVTGGETRAASVRAGLEALKEKGVGRVLIHDAARPCLDAATIDAVIAALKAHDGAAPALAVTDALWRTEGGASITGIRDRADTARAQTPQGFRFEAILSAHRAARGDEPDDIAVALAAGLDLAAVPGDEDNIKITQPGDLARAARILGGDVDIRTGNGFDVHRFGPGDHVMLCGLRVAHDRGLQGHSDADVGMHALTDAIYGALAAGDIGRHFPPTDAKWRASDSAIFLAHAISLVRERGYELSHADVTLICEQPKIGPHVQAMRERLAAITGAPVERISVKATTTERLGFTGRGEGIAAQATATLVRI